jgi:CelD/BcsL family acetyltransferase involved in cellulose biosynthesis
MALEGTTWRPDDVTVGLAAEWDRLASGRGTQADIYSSYAWFRAVLDGHPGLASRVVVPAVVGDGAPVALLPLRRQGWGWVSAHADHAQRCRPSLDPSVPEPEACALLVEQMGRAGVRELVLRGLPTRDPATTALVAALRDDGFVVEAAEKRTDNVVPVAADLEAYERSQRKLVTSSRARERRVTPFWDMAVTTYGADGAPLEEGLAQFEAISAESWKGSRRHAARRTRQALLSRADELGWLRLMILSIGGRPAAGNIFFRLGEVFVGWNTVYDQRLSVLSPGQILHRYVQEAVGVDPPGLLDLLPGDNPFKETLGVLHPPLLDVEARRPTPLRSSTHPVRRWARHHVPGATHRAQMRLVHARNGLRARRAVAAPGRRMRIAPAPGGGADSTVTEVELTVPLQRYLAVVHGLPNATAVATRWPDDRWFHVEPGTGRALVRLAAPDGEGAEPAPVATLDVVPLETGTDLRLVAEAVAGHLGEPVDLVLARESSGVAAEQDLPPLPWSTHILGEGQPVSRTR